MFQEGEEPFARFARDGGDDGDGEGEKTSGGGKEPPLSYSIENDEPEPKGKTKTRNPKITTTLQNTILLSVLYLTISTKKGHCVHCVQFCSQNLMITIIGEQR